MTRTCVTPSTAFRGIVVLCLALCSVFALRLHAGEQAEKPRVVVQLVTENGPLVSDSEKLEPVTQSRYRQPGIDAVLWVRNASVDRRFFFERFYEGKYIGRKARLELEREELGTGEHFIEPGHHPFTLEADGSIRSNDPNVRVQGNTLSLRLHKVTVMGVDSKRPGPPEFRMIPSKLGLYDLGSEVRISADVFPNPNRAVDLAALAAKKEKAEKPGAAKPSMVNILSHPRMFMPLSVYLPANQVGQGYVLYPSWQTFHVTPDGNVDVRSTGAPAVPGVEVEGAKILIPYARYTGKLNSQRLGRGITGGIGRRRPSEAARDGKVAQGITYPLRREMYVSPTLEKLEFRAGTGNPPPEFFLPLMQGSGKYPNKFLLADHTAKDPEAVRLAIVEWEFPVLSRGECRGQVSLRFMESPGKTSVPKPRALMWYSLYDPRQPKLHKWYPVQVLDWKNGKEEGPLSFVVPDLAQQFVVFRVMIESEGKAIESSSLVGEIQAFIAEDGQEGSACFVSNKGRNAFVTGEEIQLTLVIRSRSRRRAGEREITLKGPGGLTQRLVVNDDGAEWWSTSFRLPERFTTGLMPGTYALSVANLPQGVHSVPFAFDLVPRQKKSLFRTVKGTKYDGTIDALFKNWDRQDGVPPNLDRVAETLAELGYNRIDFMTSMRHKHGRAYVWREELSELDPRLPAPESVYSPSPRNRFLNACVRHGIEFCDTLLYYGDFYLARYIEGYTNASRRWATREAISMRHSPAFDGLMVYQEMYTTCAVGFVPGQKVLFTRIRDELLKEKTGLASARILSDFQKYLSRPEKQRKRRHLENYLRWGKFESRGWEDFNRRVADAAREVAPNARIGTFHRTGLKPGHATGIENGYMPDVFEPLDIISHIHYLDNLGCWVHIPIMAPILRTGPRRLLYLNHPVNHEWQNRGSGEYQRHMAFACLAQAVDGISHWGTFQSFNDHAGNGVTFRSRETTKHLNREILQPFGEILRRTSPDNSNIGIVNTISQHLLGDYKPIPAANKIEALWVACWRLGYATTFLRETDFERSVNHFKVIFVPGVHFDGELAPAIIDRLREAIAAGVKVVVEKGSQLKLPGLIRLEDMDLLNYCVGGYFPTWFDDELNQVYNRSQVITDYLSKKLPELGVEPEARGPFKVAPKWYSGGQIHYLVMANYEDPEYGHSIKNTYTKPVRMALILPARKGKVAYDLMAGKQLLVEPAGEDHTKVTLDMTRIQGAIVAFLPEEIRELRARVAPTQDGAKIRLRAELVGNSGDPIRGLFPAHISLMDKEGAVVKEFYRVLGQSHSFELPIPFSTDGAPYSLQIREALSGRVLVTSVRGRAMPKSALELLSQSGPHVPYPEEVRAFLSQLKKVTIVATERVAGLGELALELQRELQAKGVDAQIKKEDTAYHRATGNPDQDDPLNDGFHTWIKGQYVIEPNAVVDEDVILLATKSSSHLCDQLLAYGFITFPPIGGPGKKSRPSIQLAKRGLHYAHDTLCLIAGDTEGFRQVVDRLLKGIPVAPPPKPPSYGAETTRSSDKGVPSVAPVTFMGTNEMVVDVQFDQKGNLYIITWGHGKNLYSLGPTGKLRFCRHLPEMGASRLQLADDRLLVFTSAGARLYQLTLDGKPISQLRLPMDPGPVGGRDNYGLARVNYHYLKGRRQVLFNAITKMILIDERGNPIAQWQGERFEDKDVSDKWLNRGLQQFVVSPDETKVAQLETSFYYQRHGISDRTIVDVHLVVRDLSGKLLHEAKTLANVKGFRGQIVWPDGEPGPIVISSGLKHHFSTSLELISQQPYSSGMFNLTRSLSLHRVGRCMLLTRDGEEVSMTPAFDLMPTHARLSPDERTLAFIDEYGLVSIIDASNGELRHRFTVDELGSTLRFTPDSNTLIIGSFRSAVTAYRLDGRQLWQTRLEDYNTDLDKPLPLLDPSFKDYTENLWPIKRDEPGELDKMVRMGRNRLVNGQCEKREGWQGQDVGTADQGYRGRCLRLDGGTMSQSITRYLGHHVTWVLEFFYRKKPGADGSGGPLVAGVRVEGGTPDSFVRRFTPTGQWQFARIAVKGGKDPDKMTVGFSAKGGSVLVDEVSMRQIRFPSVNHAFYGPLNKIEPVLLHNPLFAGSYNPVGRLRSRIPNPIIVPPLESGAPNLIESAFLQNGRINDITSKWYNYPWNRPYTYLDIPVGFKEPRWVSMVGLHFNAYDEDNITPHFDVYATDLATKKELKVASIRHNGQLFRLVKFKPVKAAVVTVRLINTISRLRTLTEMEVYGPLSGQEGRPGFTDPEGQNTYMGDFSRVDKRKKHLAVFAPPAASAGYNNEKMHWQTPSAQIMVSDDNFYVTRALGINEAYSLEKPSAPSSRERVNGIGFSPYVSLYGGLLLKTGNRGTLHCIDPPSGRSLWSRRLDKAPMGCPVAIQEDVIAATTTGRLFKLDLANGSIMMEASLTGGVRGSLTTDGQRLFFISEDGFLWNIRADDFKILWKHPVAPHSDSTVAVDKGVIFLADQEGSARAISVLSGKPIWQTSLGQELTRCPVVTGKHVIFGCRDGKLVVMDRSDGREVWSKRVKSRFCYEPLVLDGQVLYFDSNTAMLANLQDGQVAPLTIPKKKRGRKLAYEQVPFTMKGEPLVSMSYYKGSLFFVPRHFEGKRGGDSFKINFVWHDSGGLFYVLKPKPLEKDGNGKARPG